MVRRSCGQKQHSCGQKQLWSEAAAVVRTMNLLVAALQGLHVDLLPACRIHAKDVVT